MKLKLIGSFNALLQEGESCHRNEDGQIILFTALAGLALVMMVATIFNIGVVIGEKMKVQDTADAAAYSQAVWEARVLNLLAYTNRAIISHMVTIAFATAMISQERLWYEINLVATALQPIPIVGPIIKAIAQTMWQIWNVLKRFAPPIQEAARGWISACQIFQDAMMLEFVGRDVIQGHIPNKIANRIDPTIQMNRAGNIIGGVAVNVANTMSLRQLVGTSRSAMDFTSLKKVYIASMDGFSKGTSLPRGTHIPGKPLFEFGLEGKLDVRRDKIIQKEGFSVKWIWVGGPFGLGYWVNEKFISVASESYNGLQLGDFNMWSVQKSRQNPNEKNFPSVYTYAQKNGDKILQIPLLGSGADQNLTAFSRAEVFYWDPEQPKRAPNLFNPFWHARLGAADRALDFLPEGWTSLVPITH